MANNKTENQQEEIHDILRSLRDGQISLGDSHSMISGIIKNKSKAKDDKIEELQSELSKQKELVEEKESELELTKKKCELIYTSCCLLEKERDHLKEQIEALKKERDELTDKFDSFHSKISSRLALIKEWLNPDPCSDIEGAMSAIKNCEKFLEEQTKTTPTPVSTPTEEGREG